MNASSLTLGSLGGCLPDELGSLFFVSCVSARGEAKVSFGGTIWWTVREELGQRLSASLGRLIARSSLSSGSSDGWPEHSDSKRWLFGFRPRLLAIGFALMALLSEGEDERWIGDPSVTRFGDMDVLETGFPLLPEKAFEGDKGGLSFRNPGRSIGSIDFDPPGV